MADARGQAKKTIPSLKATNNDYSFKAASYVVRFLKMKPLFWLFTLLAAAAALAFIVIATTAIISGMPNFVFPSLGLVITGKTIVVFAAIVFAVSASVAYFIRNFR